MARVKKTSLKQGVTVVYDIENKDALKPIVQQVANDFDIEGAGSLIVNGSDTKVLNFNNALVEYDSSESATTVTFSTSPQKLNPQLSISPSSLTLEGTATVTAEQQGDAVIEFYSNSSNVTVTRLSANQCIVTPNVVSGEASIYAEVPESADYYSQYKVVPVIVDVKPVIDLNFDGNRINDLRGNQWELVGDVTFEDNLAVVGSGQYLKMELSNDQNFKETDFTIEMIFTPTNWARTYIGVFAAFNSGLDQYGEGIFIGKESSTWYSYIATGSGYWSLMNTSKLVTMNEEVTVKLVREGSDAKFFVDGELLATVQNSYIYSYNNDKHVCFGQTPLAPYAESKLKSLKIYKGFALY